MPVLTQAVADTIFNALAAVINARALGGVSGVFAGGAQAEDARMQRDFLTFLRDAKPLASVQRVHVGSPGVSGVELTAAMHFHLAKPRWAPVRSSRKVQRPCRLHERRVGAEKR